MTIMLVLSILLAVAFPAIVIWKTKEIPKSISSMVYVFEGGKRWLWTIWLWAVTFLLAPSLIESMPEDFKFMGFLTLLCLTITAAMPLFDKEHERWHHVFGIASCVLSQLCVLFICPWWLLAWVLFPLAYWLYYRKDVKYKFLLCYAFIAECLCALAQYGALHGMRKGEGSIPSP